MNMRFTALPFALVAAACSQSPTQRAATEPEQPYGPQSGVSGPFVNEAVSPMPTLQALPARGSTAPLIRGGEGTSTTTARPSEGRSSDEPTAANGQNNGQNSGEPQQPQQPAQVGDPLAEPQRPTRDALLDGLVGTWADGPETTTRPGGGSVTSNCVVTIRSPTDAREVCTTTTFYGSQRDACGNTNTTRVWETASPYTLTVESGNVRFLPGTVELVRDDEASCRTRRAGSHTIMVTRDWTGSGSTLNVTTMGLDGSNPGSAVYRRTHRSGER